MSFKLGYNELKTLLKAYGYEDFVCNVVADYLDEHFNDVDYDLDLSYYIHNTLIFNVHIFETKDEALEHIEGEGLRKQDYALYECSEGINSVYLEEF